MSKENYQAEAERLRLAIIKHRSQKADDRCIEDDDELYAALGDGITCDRRVGDKLAMLQNCARFIERRCEGGGWPTYADIEERLRVLEEAQYVPGELRCPQCGFHLSKRILYAFDGSVGVNTTAEKEYCPNDEQEMERVTWEQACLASYETNKQLFEALQEARGEERVM